MSLSTENPAFAQTQQAIYTALSTPALTDGAKAAGTLTFTGVVADGQTVTIGASVYEFDTGGGVTPGNVAVNVSGGVTAPLAVTALVAAITGDAAAVVTAADGTGDTVVCTAKAWGTAPNAYATTTTCTNATWGAVTLTGGVVYGATVNVYAPVAKADAVVPYVVIGEDFVGDWSTKDTWGTSHLWRIHIWDKGRDQSRTMRIAAAIVGRLANATVTIGGGSHTLVSCRLENASFFSDDLEGSSSTPYFHGVLDLRALVSQ